MPIFDFEANKNVDTLEVVPEQYRGLYVEADNGFTISESATSIIADYVGTSKALEKSKADKKAASDESAQRRITTKAYDDILVTLGIEEDDRNAEGLQKYVEGLNDQIKGGKENRTSVEKIQAQAEERIRAAVATKDEELAGMAKSLHTYMIGEAAVRELTSVGGSADLLMPHVVSSAKVIKNEEGEYQVRVVDDQGDIRYDGAGGFFLLKDLVSEMKASEKFGAGFKSEQKSGGGSQPGSGHTVATQQKGELSSAKKIEAGLDALQKR